MNMATKVFISWSGELSRKLGEALRNWLPASLQYVRPYFSPDDIEKGAKWNSEITKELETSNIGLICLTPDNTEKPWILFESGALSKSIDKSLVCTLLFDLDLTDIKGPLTTFQATKFVRDDFKRLVTTINNCAGENRLEPPVLESVFNIWWPRLNEQVIDILKTHDKGAKRERRSEHDILEEILDLSRINAEGVQSLSQINPQTLMRLAETLSELISFATYGHSSKSLISILSDIGGPFKELCNRALAPEAYSRYIMSIRVEDVFPVKGKKREGIAEQEPGDTGSQS